MTSFEEKLLAGFRHAERINAALWCKGDSPEYLRIDELHWLIEDTYGVKINLYTVDVETSHLFGLIERYNDRGANANVYLIKNIAPRWKRFVGVKELCHVIIDDPSEDFGADGVDTLQRLLVEALVDRDAPENATLRSEHVAELVAYELLYPHEDRKADIAKIETGEKSAASISAALKLPEEIVRAILHPVYVQACDRYWKIVYEENQRAALARRGVSE